MPSDETFSFNSSIGCGTASGNLGACTFAGSIITVPVTTTIAAGSSVSIQVGNFTVPNYPPPTDSFTITTYDASGYSIDSNNTYWVPALKCASPCEDCVTGQPTNCTACYTNTTLKYLDSVADTCVSTCSSGYYANSTSNTCIACNTNCLTCSGTATTCTSCKTTGATLFYADNSVCYTTCPNNSTVKTYASGTTCLDCDSTC